jgi:hypothetical protein
MGLFDSSQTTETSLQLPGYMQDIPGLLSGELRGLIGQDYLSPDQLVADWSSALTGGVNQLIGSGQGQQMMGQDIAQTGMAGLGGFGAGQGAMMNVLGQGPMQNMGVDMAQVGGMINNDVLQGQIDAALRDPYRMLTEQQLPQAGLAAAASGNTGSTRRGVGEAILQRGFEDRAADVGGAMRGQAYGQALGIGAQQAAQNAGLGAQFQGLQGQLGQNLVNSAIAGGNLAQMGQAMNLGGIENIMRGGQMQTGQQQALLNAGKEGFLFDYQMLPSLMQMGQGLGQTFGTQVSETSQDMGIGNTLLGAGLGLAGSFAAGGMNPFGFMGNMFGGGGGGGMGFDPSGMVPFIPT